jgi:hypothetical protein
MRLVTLPSSVALIRVIGATPTLLGRDMLPIVTGVNKVSAAVITVSGRILVVLEFRRKSDKGRTYRAMAIASISTIQSGWARPATCTNVSAG